MTEIFLVHDLQASPAERRTYLERAGYSVRATSNASECLAWLRDSAPALIVMDVLVEGQNGFDACRLVRDRHAPRDLPIVLGCHLYTEPVYAEEAARAGAQRYVHLPIAPADLLRIVHELLGARARPEAA